MKQKLFKTMLLLCALVAGSTNVWAIDITLETNDSKTYDGITITPDIASGSNAPIYGSSYGVRMYANNTLTISAETNITGITFNWTKNGSKEFANVTASTGSYSHPGSVGTGTWSGSANSITFTVGSSGQIQLQTLAVTLGSGPTTYTVTYNANGADSGDVPEDNTAYSSGATVTVLGNTGSLTKTDYTFDGWNTASDGSGTNYAPDATFSISANTTLYAKWAASEGTGIIRFGSAVGSTKIQGSSETGTGTVTYTDSGSDSQGKTWTITTVSSTGKSFTQNASYSQIGASSKPATSITFTTTLPSTVNITDFSAKFGGFSGTAGTVTLKVGDTTVGTGSLDATNDVTVSNSKAASGTVLTVTVTGISKGVKAYYISYAEGSLVDVTGVTLNKNSTTLSVGDTETLTATIAPTEATNKVVTWGSSDDAVATVVDGVVTAVAEGTATITVTTDDGGYTDNCVVTVNPAPTPAVTLDFTSNTGWSFPTAKEEGPATYNNGCYITLQGSSSNGYYFDTSSNNLLLGKSGATLTLPAFPFNVNKIKVYGTGGSGGSSSVTFNIFVGGVAVSSEATSSNEDHVFNIAADKQAAGTVYVIKVTNANNMRITRIEVFGDDDVPITIGAAGYTTFSAPCAVDFSATGLTVYTAAVSGDEVVLTTVDSKLVPANTGVILGGATSTGTVIASAPALAGNDLLVSDGSIVGDLNTIFALGKKNGTVGFYLVGDDVTVPAGKAYLEVTSPVKEFLTFSFEDDADGLERVQDVQEVQGAIFNLAGQRLSKMQKGINIINGRKVLK